MNIMHTIILVVMASGFSGLGGMLLMAGLSRAGNGQGGAYAAVLAAAGVAFIMLPIIAAMLVNPGAPARTTEIGVQRPVIGDKDACMPGRAACAQTRKKITDRIRADIESRITPSHVTSGKRETVVRPSGGLTDDARGTSGGGK